MTRRAEWMSQLHQWFDYWLFGVQNGIMSQPRVDIENTKDSWATYADWPLPTTKDVTTFLQGDTPTTRRQARRRLGRRDRHAEVDGPREPERGDRDEHRRRHDAEQPPRLPLARAEVRPAPVAARRRSTSSPSLDKPQSNLTAMLVDYGPSTQITRSSDGISTPANAPSDCWGSSGTRTGRQRRRDRLRRLLPAADQADGDGHRDAGLAHLARDPGLVQPRLAVLRRDRRRRASSTRSSSRSCPWTTRSRPAIASASC